jgi:hypothetical protein
MAIKRLTNTSNISNTGHYWGTTGTITGTTTGNITTGGYVYPSTTLIANPGSLQSSGTTLNWTDGTFMNSDIVEYIDIFYQLMGIDMDYKRFSIMTKDEKRAFIRDIKLKKLIDEK